MLTHCRRRTTVVVGRIRGLSLWLMWLGTVNTVGLIIKVVPAIFD